MGMPLYRVDELRKIEAQAAAALAPNMLMQRAGLAAADFIARRCVPADGTVLFVCGPGNNGGDGFEAAGHLQQRGYEVTCVALDSPAADDAREAFARYRDCGGRIAEALPPADADLGAVVDAMFGIGLARPLGGKYLAAAGWIREQRAPVVALDVPSGLDADTGAWIGDVAGVVATATLTFIGAKPALFTHCGCDAAGAVEVASLGLAPDRGPGTLSAPDDFASVTAPRRRDSHKGSYGDVVVVGGGHGMVGAPLLAARAALRLGAGRVYVDCIGAPDLRCDPAQPELMFRSAASLARADAWVAGCGLGNDAPARSALAAVLQRDQPMVLDADALNLLAADADLRHRLAASGAVRVLTPHPLEAARLLGTSAAVVQRDRIGATLRLACEFGACVVLKGAGSVIAAADGHYWVNPTGGPALATPGTGDVLAGMIGALLAQGFAPVEAGIAAVWLHGAAADAHRGDVGLVASDLPRLAAQALVGLRERRSA